MAKLSFAESSPEVARHGFRIVDEATRRRGSRFEHQGFMSIQRAVHKDQLPFLNTTAANAYLYNHQDGDRAAALKAVVGYTDPKALSGYDYSNLDTYGEIVRRILEDPELARKNPSDLYDFVLRGSKTRTRSSADKTLALAKWPTVHDTPPVETGSGSPDGKDEAYSKLLVEDPSVRLAVVYLNGINPSDYEATSQEVSIAKALCLIRIEESEKDSEPIKTPNFKYPSVEHLEERLAILNRNQLPAEIHELVAMTVLKVPRLYGLAMAVRELREGLPEGSPNMSALIDFLGGYTIQLRGETYTPYHWLSAAGLSTVFSRRITAGILLDKPDLLRGNRNFIKVLGGSLRAQGYKQP